MVEGKLIIEVYEYVEGANTIPSFEYVPCPLANCFKHNNKSTLKEIVQKGFDVLPRKEQNSEKRREFLQMLEEADIGRIDVVYKRADTDSEECIELTNLMPVSMADADARRTKNNKNDIILYGKYRLTDGNETTRLRDAQRLTLVYSSFARHNDAADAADESEDQEVSKEICLNITYLQE